MNTNRNLIITGVLGAKAVALGALGAHWLKNQIPGGLITPDQLNGFDTGVKYHMYHTLAMLIITLLYIQNPNKFFKWAYNLFFIGIILFSGSLYFLCTRNLYGAEFLRILGPITPLGGLFFIAGWLSLVLAGFRKKKDQ